jgi:hypothetical protein
MSLSFTADSSPGCSESYTVAVRDENGTAVFTAQLSRELVDKAVLAQAGVTVALALSGDVYADLDAIEVPPLAQIPIDELVAQAVEPKMLEDEPHAEALLKTLRRKLIAAVSAVDAALASINKR